MLLGYYVFYLFCGVDETHYQFDVTSDSCWKNNGLTFFTEISEEIIKIFAFVNIEKTFILFKPKMEVLLPAWSHHESLLIRSKNISQYLIHFHDNSQFAGIIAWRQYFRFIGIVLKHFLDEVGLIFRFSIDRREVSRLFRFFIEESLGERLDKSFSYHVNIDVVTNFNINLTTPIKITI